MIKPTSTSLFPKCPTCGAALCVRRDPHAPWCTDGAAIARMNAQGRGHRSDAWLPIVGPEFASLHDLVRRYAISEFGMEIADRAAEWPPSCWGCTVPVFPGFPHLHGCAIAKARMELEAKTLVARFWPGDCAWSYFVGTLLGVPYATGFNMIEDMARASAESEAIAAREATSQAIPIEAWFTGDDHEQLAANAFRQIGGQADARLIFLGVATGVHIAGPLAPELMSCMVVLDRPTAS